MKNFKNKLFLVLILLFAIYVNAQDYLMTLNPTSLNFIDKDAKEFEGKPHLLEHAFKADFAIVKAWKGDTNGNLIYKGTARNFNPLMAMAGQITVAEVEELVEPGELDPNFIHTPGIFVQRIFQGKDYEKRIEQRTVREK